MIWGGVYVLYDKEAAHGQIIQYTVLMFFLQTVPFLYHYMSHWLPFLMATMSAKGSLRSAKIFWIRAWVDAAGPVVTARIHCRADKYNRIANHNTAVPKGYTTINAPENLLRSVRLAHIKPFIDIFLPTHLSVFSCLLFYLSMWIYLSLHLPVQLPVVSKPIACMHISMFFLSP